MQRATVEQRFWSKVDKQPSGCWLWTGAPNADGYGQFRLNGATPMAHRVAWEWLRGPIPAGLFLDHDNPAFGCRNPLCVNPEHLEPVTNAVNLQRRRGAQSNNLNGHRGVTRLSNGRYQARAMLDGERHYGGMYDTAEEAGAAAESLRQRLYEST